MLVQTVLNNQRFFSSLPSAPITRLIGGFRARRALGLVPSVTARLRPRIDKPRKSAKYLRDDATTSFGHSDFALGFCAAAVVVHGRFHRPCL